MVLHEFCRKTKDNVFAEPKVDTCLIHFYEYVAEFFHVDTACADHNRKTGASSSLKRHSRE